MEQQGNEAVPAGATEKQEGNLWVRGLLMALFIAITRIVEIVVIAVLLAQFLFKLITKKPNQRLTDFGESLSIYIASIVRYQTFNSEERPFPFAAWPKVERASPGDSSGDDKASAQAQAS